MTCHDQLKTTNELLDITTRHAFGEEVIEAVFVQGDGKMVPQQQPEGTIQSYW
jgi:hypothetical protein